MISGFVQLITGLGIVGVVAFSLLQWLQIPSGTISDWLVGGAIFAWLLTIVTIPWNIHFSAREVLYEAEISKEKGILVDSRKISYVRTLAERSLIAAIALHLVSTIVLYYLAANGYTNLGYIGAIAALLLTVLRPVVRAYLFWVRRLESIRQEFLYPREDVVELRTRVLNLESSIKQVQREIDIEDQRAGTLRQQELVDSLRQQLNQLSAMLEELRATNNLEHERIGRESKQLVSQLTTDGQFLDHVREIIRFFKSA